MIRFGPWSTLLAAGLGFGLLVAALLWSRRANRTANRLLAALIAVLSLKLLPYVLGFAGFYMAYPWLSFLPVSFGLAMGPLLYLHVRRLYSHALPRGWLWHLAPAALQCGYYVLLFPQPLAFKDAFAERWDAPLIDPLETWLELVSLWIYLLAARRCHRRYQVWLDARLSNREEFRRDWLGRLLTALLWVVPLWIVFEALSAWSGFDYFQRVPLYLALVVLLLYLGLEGWRHADLRYPPREPEPPTPEPAPSSAAALDDAPDEEAGRDWAALGERWRRQLAQEGWWRDPELSLDALARRLGTNTGYLSRAFNQGLGQSFNAVVNGLRVDAVCAQLDAGGPCADLLALGLEAGFSSKTSFNRVFKAQTGLTPSAYRARAAAAGAKV